MRVLGFARMVVGFSMWKPEAEREQSISADHRHTRDSWVETALCAGRSHHGNSKKQRMHKHWKQECINLGNQNDSRMSDFFNVLSRP